MSKQDFRTLIHEALFNGNGIARRLIVSVILFSTLITTIATALQLYGEYRSDVNNVEYSFDFIGQSTLPVLIENVWVNDTEQIKSQLHGLLNLRDMAFTAIYVNKKMRWSAGQLPTDRRITKRFIMTREYRGKRVTIGTLVTVASKDQILQRLWKRLLTVLIDNGIKTLLVALFMMLLFQIMVTRHLVKISSYARGMNLANLDREDLKLDRSETGKWRPDALDYLSQAINDMRGKLLSTYTELQENEERLRLAMQTTNDGVWDWSVTNNKVIYSPGWCHMLGYEVDELPQTYETWESRLHPDDRESVLAKLKAQLDNKAEFIAQFRMRTRSGHWLWTLGRGGVIERDDKGQPLRAIGTMTDISNLKRAEQQLKQVNDELEQRVAERTEELLLARDEAQRASRAKTSFLSRMSHELRTPLNAILGFAQLLEIENAPSLSSQQKDFVMEILHAGNHLLDLINEILDLARIESGRIDINLEAIPLNPLINESLSLLAPLAKQQSVSLHADMEPKCVVRADHMRLNQVLLNLLSNAIKFNQPGGEVRIMVKHQGPDSICIAITDTGIGIDEQDQQHLFRPFERLEQSADMIEGSGIGLALSKHLVEAMQGTIGIDSQPGKGSTFWVVLPTAEAKAVTFSSSQLLPPAKPSSMNKGSHQILYVEDNMANLKLMQKIISPMSNLELFEATTAEEGLKIAVAQQPDLIFLDITLPGMDGYSALHALQINPQTRHIPVVAVTANATAHDIEKGLASGFVAYITKPFDVAQIRQTIEEKLTKRI